MREFLLLRGYGGPVTFAVVFVVKRLKYLVNRVFYVIIRLFYVIVM